MTRHRGQVPVCVPVSFSVSEVKIMDLDKETVASVAKLCRIEIQEQDLTPMAQELSNILSWIEQLREVDVSSCEPLSSVVEAELKTRDDTVMDGDLAEDVVGNAPDSTNNYFLVPKVIE